MLKAQQEGDDNRVEVFKFMLEQGIYSKMNVTPYDERNLWPTYHVGESQPIKVYGVVSYEELEMSYPIYVEFVGGKPPEPQEVRMLERLCGNLVPVSHEVVVDKIDLTISERLDALKAPVLDEIENLAEEMVVRSDLKALGNKKTKGIVKKLRKFFKGSPKLNASNFTYVCNSYVKPDDDRQWIVTRHKDREVYEIAVTKRHLPNINGPSYNANKRLGAAYDSTEHRPIKVFQLSGVDMINALPYVDYELYFKMKEKFVFKGRTVQDRAEMTLYYDRLMSEYDSSCIPAEMLYMVKLVTIHAVMQPTAFEAAAYISMRHNRKFDGLYAQQDIAEGNYGQKGCLWWKRDLILPKRKNT